MFGESRPEAAVELRDVVEHDDHDVRARGARVLARGSGRVAGERRKRIDRGQRWQRWQWRQWRPSFREDRPDSSATTRASAPMMARGVPACPCVGCLRSIARA